MLTNNFASCYKGIQENDMTADKYPIYTTSTNTRNKNASKMREYLNIASNDRALFLPTGPGVTLVIGTGTTEALPSNYTLASPLSDGTLIEVITQSSVQNLTVYGPTMGTVSRTVKNISNKNIIITEVGLFSRDSSDDVIMLYREVLDTPVTLQPGKKHTFTIDLCVA